MADFCQPEQASALIAGRRTVHRFAPSTLNPADLDKALELALTAPNHRFTFPWQFIHCGPETREKLYSLLYEKLKKKMDSHTSEEQLQTEFQEKWRNPAALVIFARKISSDPQTDHENYATIACAIQNFTLYLYSCGFDSKWSTTGLIKDPRTYEILGLNADEIIIDGFILVGKSLLDRHPPRRRPKLDEVKISLP